MAVKHTTALSKWSWWS